MAISAWRLAALKEQEEKEKERKAAKAATEAEIIAGTGLTTVNVPTSSGQNTKKDTPKTTQSGQNSTIPTTSAWRNAAQEEQAKGGGTSTVSPQSGSSSSGGKYYSKPDLYRHADNMNTAISAIEEQLNIKKSEVDKVAQTLKQLYAKVEANPRDSATIDQYNALFSQYEDLFKEYEDAWTAYNNAAGTYNTYMSGQNEQYDAWRSTIRDSEAIQADMNAINKRIKELEGYKSKFDRLTNYLSEGEEIPEGVVKYGGFSSAEEVQAEIDRLNSTDYRKLSEEKSWADYFSYADLMQEADFEEYAAKGAALKNPDKLGPKEGQQVQNVVTYFREDNPNEYYDKYTYMSDEEVDIYNYILAKEGADSAAKFLEYLEESLNRRKGEEIGKGFEDLGAFNRTLATGAYSLYAGLDQFAGNAAQLFTKENRPTSYVQYASQQISEDLPEWAKPIYSAGVSIGNMAPAIALSAATGGMGAPAWLVKGVNAAAMGVSAAGGAYGEALDNGYRPDQARTYSNIIGILEACLSFALSSAGSQTGLSEDVLLAKINALDSAAARVALTGAVRFGSEIIEEELQLYLQPAVASWIFNESYDAPTADEFLDTLLSTLISTGILEGGSVISAGSSNTAKWGAGVDAETAQAIIEEGLSADPKSPSYILAKQLQKKMEKGKTITAQEIGNLQQQNMEYVDSTADPEADLRRLAEEAVAVEKGKTPAEATEMAQDGVLSEDGETTAHDAKSAPAPARAAMSAAAEAAIPYNVLNNAQKAKTSVLDSLGYLDNGTRTFESVVETTGMSVGDVQRNFQTAYEAGLQNVPANSVSFVNPIQKAAYAAGLKDYGVLHKQAVERDAQMAQQAPVQSKGKAGFQYDAKNLPTNVTSGEATIIDELSKMLGVSTRMVGQQDYNAKLIGTTDVEIASDFQTEMTGADGVLRKTTVIDHAVHEIAGHQVIKLAPVEGRAFMNAMYGYLSENLPDTVATLAEAKTASYGSKKVGLSTDKAMEEVVVSEIFPLLYSSDPTQFKAAMDRVMNGKDEQAKKGARTFKEVLSDLWKKLKSIAAKLRGKGDVEAAREAEQAADRVKELRDMFEDAMRVAAQRVQNAQKSANETGRAATGRDTMNHSMKEGTDNGRETEVHRGLAGDHQIHGARPAGRGSGATTEGRSQNQVWYKDLSQYEKSRLKEIIIPALEEDELWGRLVRYSSMDQMAEHVCDAIIRGDGAIERMKSQIPGFERAVGKVVKFLGRNNAKTATGSRAKADGFEPAVKADSKGRTLTKAQQDFFSRAKTVDKNGNLLVLYHGSRSDLFTEFDMYEGVWLTPDQRYAEIYAEQWHSWRDDDPSLGDRRTGLTGKEADIYADPDYRIYEMYANIAEPADIGEIDDWLSDGKVREIARALGVRYTDLKQIADNYMEERTYMLTRSNEFIDFVRSLNKFDGLKATESGKETWCAIKAQNQVKLTTNKNPTTHPDVQYSIKVTDKKTLDFLNEQIERGEYDPVKNPDGGYIKVYRSFQVIDGKLYAPMNAVDRDTDGKNHRLGYNSQYGVWEMATESPEIAQRYMDAHPDAKYAMFDLDGVDNKTGGVAYNPYLHASNLVLNDQFSAAYRRKLVTVECYVPVSEMDGAYKAKYAKDATGWVEWKPGGVAGKLMKDKPEYTRKLFVSRYMLPVREMSSAEIAAKYKEYLDGTNIKVPWNVVTPELRSELVKAGVPIDYRDVYRTTVKRDDGTKEKLYTKFAEVFPDEAGEQYSMKDSAGRELSEQQREFFKDSQVRDKDGNLQVVYHGTKRGGFTVFAETDDIGYFFTSSEEVARTYSGSYNSVYVRGSIKTWEDAIKTMKEFGSDVSLKRDADGNYVLHDGTFGDAVFAPNELDKFAELYEQDYLDNEQVGNYAVYLNIKDPLIVNGNGSNWDSVYDWYEGMVTWDELTEEQQEAFIDAYGVDVEYWGVDEGGYMIPVYHPGDMHVAHPQSTRDWVREAVESGIGYDGVIFRNIVDEGEYGRGYGDGSDVYVVLNSNQAKSVYNKNPTEHDDILFSMKQPVEETKNLIALHNLTADKLTKALNLGGFPMPSIAVTKTDIPHTNFGDITLVMNKSTIDPKASKKNTVYSADAWTPTFPQIEYEADSKAASRISEKYYELYRKHGHDFMKPLYGYANYLEDELNRYGGEEGVIERHINDPRMMQVYLADIGKEPVADIKKEVVTRLDEHKVERYDYLIGKLGEDVVKDLVAHGDETPIAARKRWMAAHGEELTAAYRGYLVDSGLDADVVDKVMENTKPGDMLREVTGARNYLRTGAETVREEIDREATNAAIRKAAGKGYETWLRNLFKGVVKDTGVYNNKEMFTPSGNRRSFQQTHYPVTLENIAKAMAEQNDGNTKNVSGFYGVKSLRAGTAKRFSSIKEMHEYEGRLKHLTQEEADAITDALSERMDALMTKILDTKKRGQFSNDFMAYESVGNMLMEMSELQTKSIDTLSKKAKEWHYDLNSGIVAEIRDLLFDVAQMPVNIFEAKPERAVRFDEVLAAVLPDNAPAELQARLEQEGVNVLTYPAGDDAARLEAVNGVEDAQFSMKEQAKVMRDNARLKEVNAALKAQFKTTKFAKVDPKSLRSMAKSLVKDYESDADIDDVQSDLDTLYTYLANDDPHAVPATEAESLAALADSRDEFSQPSKWSTAFRMAYDIAEHVLENASVLNDELYREYEDLRRDLRTRGISISREYEHDLGRYESLAEFRKANFGRILIKNNGLDVNTYYQELSSRYPGLFNEYEVSHPADQLLHIEEVLDSFQPVEENPFSHNMREVATWLANDIMERFFSLPQAKPTFADKAERRLTEQVIKDAKKMEQVRERSNERAAKVIAEYREKVKEIRKQEKAAKWDKVEKIKEHYKAKEAKMSESRRARVLRERITRHASELKQKLLRATDKKHIPQELQGAVAKLLECINLESKYEYAVGEEGRMHRVERGTAAHAEPAKRTQAFAELQAVYAQLGNELTIDPDLLGDDGLLNDVVKLADKPIATMTSEELQIVWETMRAVESSIRTANKTHNATRWNTVVEAAEALREDNKGKRDKVELRGILGKGQKLTGLDMETPETYFHMLGNAGDSLFRMMRDSQDQHIRLMGEVAKFTHETLGKVNVRKLESQMHDVTLGGENVKLSTAQIMELYVLMKREQALDHIFVGGILPDVVSAKGLKKVTKAKPVRGISLSEVSAAVSQLTEEQRKIADRLQLYASNTLSKWGNKASMDVYGYEKFGEKNYWPIRSNRQEIKSDVQKDTAVTSLANRSFTKGTRPHANNSLRLGSIFDTFATHASEMATYSAWLGTLDDINRIRNFTFKDEDGHAVDTVKGIIDTVHGTSGNAYLDKLLSDVTNGVKGTHGETAYMSGLVGNFKAAAVGANLRVIIQQPTAMLRAADMIGAQYLATPGNPIKGWNKAKKYAPIAQWKDWGYFDINTGRQMKDVLFDSDTAVDKVKSITMWGAGAMDSLAWGQLWNAVERETKAKHQELKPGTTAFYEAVAKRFTEIVDHTQVVDGILQRSQIMRSADSVTKMATSFMGEPTKQYNMMMQAAYDARKVSGKDRKAAVRKLARTSVVLAISGVANAMAQSIIDAVRDDDKEKEYWEKWLASFKENLGSTFNPVGYVPFAKDVLSILQGYDVTRMDMESIEKLVSAGQNMIKALSGEGKYTVGGAAINLIAEVARLFGIPVANLKREITSFAMLAAVESDNYLMQYRMEKWMLNMNGNGGKFMDILYNAYMNDKDVYEIIYADLVDSGYDPEKIKTGMETRMKNAQGVDSVKDLNQRYLPPDLQPEYDKTMGKVRSNMLWRNANEEQRDKVESKLYNYVCNTEASNGMHEILDAGKPYGLDETEYLLYNLALDMYDQPNENGELGSHTQEEKADAILAVSGLSNGEIAVLWDTDTGYELFDAGINMLAYVEHIGSGGSVSTDKLIDAKQNGIVEDTYFDFLDMLDRYDQPTESGKYGTFTQDEATAAIAAMPGLTRAQRAYLWQSVNKSWKTKNNPWK